uniref:thiopurine S-methyltransferase n=1 Tax=Periophthalmus magnuspinnatus TaxID=409849 RepID=A0A3B4BA76_9GOBI
MLYSAPLIFYKARLLLLSLLLLQLHPFSFAYVRPGRRATVYKETPSLPSPHTLPAAPLFLGEQGVSSPAERPSPSCCCTLYPLCCLQLNRRESNMSNPQENQFTNLEEWVTSWEKGQTGFHEINIDKVLAGRTGVKFFFPLCGKAVDMKWLADMGHTVVGVEISEKAIREFFEESKMSYSEEPVPTIPGAKVFRNTEKTVSLYQCDISSFSSSLEGQFGAIWDRGAFVVINLKDRAKYAALMVSLMAPDCRFLLDTMLYNPERYSGIFPFL